MNLRRHEVTQLKKKKVCLVCLEREGTTKSSCGRTGDADARKQHALLALRSVEKTN